MSTLSKFLGRFGGEYHALATIVGIVADGIALDPRDKEKVLTTVGNLKNAAVNISESVENGLNDVNIDIDEIKKAIRAEAKVLLPDMIGGVVEAVARAKSEAIEAATKEANAIIADAKAQAQAIVDEAIAMVKADVGSFIVEAIAAAKADMDPADAGDDNRTDSADA